MLLRFTLAFDYALGTGRARDAVALTEAPAPGVAVGSRLFVPGWLPCGECDRCRRGLGTACASGRLAWPAGQPPPPEPVELADRYLTPVDEPAGVTLLPDEIAVTAGLLTVVLQATATASVTAADECVWLGDDRVAALGAALTRTRGCRTFTLGESPWLGPAAARSLEDIRSQRTASTGASASGHGGGQQRIFVTRPTADLVRAAFALAEPGATIVAFGPEGLSLEGPMTLPTDARLIQVSLPHPDLVPEALALLRREETLVALLPSPASADADAAFPRP